MITLFNRLTSKKLVDYTLYDHVIGYHYEKFKYLYYMIGDIDLSHIDNITCEDDEDDLIVYISTTKPKYLDDVVYTINDRKNSYSKREYFKLNVSELSDVVTLSIGIQNNEKEEDLYENRLI